MKADDARLIVTILVFQHGAIHATHGYFDNVRRLQRPCGLFFLRVNSVSTDIHYKHAVIEKEANGGLAVMCGEGPKRGLYLHFFFQGKNCQASLTVMDLRSHPDPASDQSCTPKTGSWAQWEAAAQKKTCGDEL